MANRLNLMLHCGAKAADYQQVENALTPAPTESWQPIPHVSLVNMLRNRLPDYDLQITNEAHALFGDQAERYFGLFQVQTAREDKDFSLVFGVRNSHDKTFPAGLCCGSGVFVCDNLAFSSEIVIGRRHTKHIMRDLPALMSAAVGRLVVARVDQEKRLELYKQTELTNQQAHDLIIQGMLGKAIIPTKVPHVVEQWHTPAHPEFAERTAWSLFNGFTEVMKTCGLENNPKRTTAFHGILDAACGFTASVPSAAGVEDAQFTVDGQNALAV